MAEIPVKDTSNSVPAVDRAIKILEYLGSKNWAVSVNEVSKELNIPRATAFRIMKTLENWGYVYNSNGRGDYILGTRILKFGYGIGHGDERIRLQQIAGPYCFELAQSTRQTVQLGVLFEYEVMYVEQTVATSELSIAMPNETPFPINLSAGGKVLASALPEARIRDLLANGKFPKRTDNTITDPLQLSQELNRVRQQGYAIDEQEFAVGIRCIAAPVRDANNDVVFSLGITGHVNEINEMSMSGLIEKVSTMADRISAAIQKTKVP